MKTHFHCIVERETKTRNLELRKNANDDKEDVENIMLQDCRIVFVEHSVTMYPRL